MDELLAPVPRAWVAGWVTLVGATVGSFLNVVIARLPAGQSVVRPRSRCPRCQRPIAWYDNLPVLSWLLLRGRCRGCRAPISFRYPVVELLGGAAALAAWSRHGLSWAALAEFTFLAFCLALAGIDLDTWLLPDVLTWPLLFLGLAAGALGLAASPSAASTALGAALGFGVFGLLSGVGEAVLKKEALGFGDVWLLAALGAWLGAGALLPLVLLGSIQGAVVGVVLIAVGRAQPGPPEGAAPRDEEDWVPPRNAVPFGPFLVAGAVEWLLLGDQLARLVPALELFR
jgi:leader peptidase (prepilin peptidase)/N-methyltransferase